jgi:hypothetical protein
VNLFVITGVCQAGEHLSLLLARFLAHPKTRVLLWIDFKDVADYPRIAEAVRTECPHSVMRCAPRAMWGAPSIVRSMLEAVSVCVRQFSTWDRVVFGSIHDVPLATCEEIVSCLDRDWNFDYSGSRWNASTWDILRPIETVPVIEAWEPSRRYIEYRLRPDMSLRVEDALQTIYTPAAITSFRLCQDVFERYLIGTWEFQPGGLLTVQRMTRARAQERLGFFSRYGLIAGRQWCVLGRSFCETLLGPQVLDVLPMFEDVLIPDECFFQTVAEHLATSGTLNVRWDNLYYADAQNTLIDVTGLERLVQKPVTGKLFARKAARSLTEEELDRILGSS